MAEKLSILIELLGAVEIERQLAGIGESGTKAFGEIAAAAANVGGFDKLDPKVIEAKLKKFGVTGKEAIDKITAAVSTAGRFERIAGGVRDIEVGFGKIGASASAMSQRVTGAFTTIATAAASTGGAVGRVGRSLGLLGSGALIGSLGAAALAMEKSADSARILEGNLQALFRSQKAGTAFFNQIQSAAQAAGASLEETGQTMVGIVKEIQKGLQARGFRFLPGEGLKQAADDAAQVFDILQKVMQLSGTRADDASKAIKDLFTQISQNQAARGDTFAEISGKAKRMADVLRELAARFPQLGNELAQALGRPGETMDQFADRVERGLARLDTPKLTAGIKTIGPAIQTLSDAFDPTLAQRMDTIRGAWDKLLNSFGKSPAGAAIKAAMDDIAKGLDEIAKKQEQIGKFTVDKPPATVTGGLLQQTFNEFNQNIEIAKRNWETLKTNLSDPIKVSILVANLNPAVLAINKVIGGIQQLRALTQPKDKITVPFEADPEPAWVRAYLGHIEEVKRKFRDMFKTEAEGPPQQPAWVEAYLGWIARIKAALKDALTQKPEPGGQLGGTGVPFLSGQIPADVVARGAARIEDRRGEGFDTTAVNTALTELATAAQGATQSLQGLQGLEISNIGTAVDSFNIAISSLADSMQSLSFSGMSEGLEAATAAAQQLASDLQNMGLSEVAAAMQQVVTAANSAAQALSSIQTQGGGNFARGGLLGGRGTGTSDSNLAWVSRGEHIMPARAVRQPGVLAFLEALRRSGGSLADVLGDMGRFALGGLVPRTLPAFAAGGLADMRGGGRPIALTINAGGGDRQTFQVWADADVAEKVVRYAVSRQAASAGRKSGAYD